MSVRARSLRFFSAGEEFGADALRNAWKKSVDIASGAKSVSSTVVSGPPLIGAVSLRRRRTQRAGHAHDMLGRRPQLASLLVEELRIDASALHELRIRPDLDDSPAIEHHDHRAIPWSCYVDVLEASRWPSVRPTGGATITVSPASRPPLISTPRSNSRPVRIGTCLATPSRTIQT
jgi:hypothetical protein